MTALHRILEPEVMDSPEDAYEYDLMDHREVNQIFCTDFFNALNNAPTSLNLKAASIILDIGTGTAQIPIALCKDAKELNIKAIDLAGSMLEIARKNIDEAGLQGQIKIEQVDSKNLPYLDESFHQVISNSIIHHIPRPMECFREMIRVTKKGGLLFVRDLLRPKSLIILQEIVELHTQGATPKQRALFTDSLHAALTQEEVAQMVESFGFDQATVKQTSNRHWTWSAIKS